MRDRVDYCASLLRKWPSDRPVGSNPTASAVTRLKVLDNELSICGTVRESREIVG